jgi:hypothetical protein
METKTPIIYRNGIIIRAKNTNRFFCVKKTFTSYFSIYLKGNKKQYPLHWLLYRMSQREKTILKNLYGTTKENYVWLLNSFGIQCKNVERAYQYHQNHQYVILSILNTIVALPDLHQYNYDIGFPKEDRIYPFLMTEFLKRMSKLIFGDSSTNLPKFTFLSNVPIIYEQKTIHQTVIRTHYWVYEVEKEFPIAPNGFFSLKDPIYTRFWVSGPFLQKEPHLCPVLQLLYN